MKKLLIIAGIGLLAYHFKDDIFGKTNATADTDETLDNAPGIAEDIFVKYDNQQIVDSVGNWMLVKNSKLYLPVNGQESLNKWYAENPNKPQVVKIEQPIWDMYQQTHYGGGY